MSQQIPFLVETNRVLEILSKQIYDSPFAMARENVQNAYDAVLMRAKLEGKPPAEYHIEIAASPTEIVIKDQGIGMSEAVLRENFWRAGSSGKNNDAARAAGVIGTFGIGAMANFGVCERLQVDSRELGQPCGTRTVAVKSELSIGQDCIAMESLGTDLDVGTVLTAQISAASPVDVAGLRNYLAPFIRFLAVPVLFNGELLSQQDPLFGAGIGAEWQPLACKRLTVGRFEFEVSVLAEVSQLAVVVANLSIDAVPTSGGLWLRHGGGQVMGLRSRFGLAPLPLASHYGFGGYADLPFLLPTAGREALTRDSIQEASLLIPPIERAVTEIIKDTALADQLPAFQQHLLQIGQIAWADRVLVQLSPGDRRMEMGRLRDSYPGADLHWYAGTDADTINLFSNDDAPLIRVSQQNPRRDLQRRYLGEVLKLPPVPDAATILETYKVSDLTWDEVTLTLAIARILKNDYLIDDVAVEWVRISHGVPMLAEMVSERLAIKISRTWSAIQAVLRVIASTPEVSDGMTKDFVRVHVYERIKAFVPSSQRAGLDALQKTLARRRELYRLEFDDKGDLEPLLAEYLAGHVELSDVLTAAAKASAGQTQRVSQETAGTVEKVLTDVVETAVESQPVQAILVPVPGSPILRPDADIRSGSYYRQRDSATEQP